MNIRLFIVLPLLVLAAGCAASQPRPTVRGGGPYFEEITSPAPRDALLQSPTCVVR